MTSRIKLTIERKSFPLDQPFSITGYTFTALNTVWVTLERNGAVGRGEGTGSYYLGETPDTISAQLEAQRSHIEAGVSIAEAQTLLPRGGARNALDCALWDLRCAEESTSIWNLLALTAHTVVTVATIGAGRPQEMAVKATQWAQYPQLKIKLDNREPVECVAAIRAARPDASLIVDVNQGWTLDELRTYGPLLAQLGVEMIEQPLARGADGALAGFVSPIPLGADESCLGLDDYRGAAQKYDVINVKLDKCGGLTEALKISSQARADGKKLMVGNMTGTSLGMAPSYVVAQSCDFVDIDGPLLLRDDVEHGLSYGVGGVVSIPTSALWG